MTLDRLKRLNDLSRRVHALERELEASRDGPQSSEWMLASKAAQHRAAKIIEQDLEEQLAAAKREFEEA